MPSNNIPQPDERARAQRCLDLKLQGSTWVAIAEAEGYADESGARRAAQRLLDRTGSELVAEYREVELGRLDALQARHWPAAMAGDLKAAEFVLKVSAQRSRLLGLNVPEKVIVAEAAALTDEDFAETAARLMQEIAMVPQSVTRPISDDDQWSNIGD